MVTEDMIKYLENPQQLNDYSLSELRALLRRYPYFHTAHVLFLLNLKNINDPRYREFLKQSAVYIKDRDKFLRLVNQLEGSRDVKQAEGSSGKGQASDEPAIRQAALQGNAGEDAREKSTEKDKPRTTVREEQTGKAVEGRRDKDFSTEYLRSRIAETLSEQKGDAGDRDKRSPELGSDFFIIDKVSQVEEKMARRLRKKYQEETRQKQDARKQDEADSDLFELDSSAGAELRQSTTRDETGGEDQPELRKTDNTAQSGDPSAGQGQPGDKQKKSTANKEVFHFGGEYFSEKEYRRNQEAARKEQSDLIEQFIRKAPEMGNITPSEKDNQDISEESVEEKEDLASEKLIKVYIQQGYYKKAIEAYEKLSLKYPEKSDYFAEQIKKLKPYIHKQKK
ncbi:MAG: hypothetical protein KGY60_10085 [Bacteroidales bacterium]|nr:hypothetical protein [Bacteroidales bacterium]